MPAWRVWRPRAIRASTRARLVAARDGRRGGRSIRSRHRLYNTVRDQPVRARPKGGQRVCGVAPDGAHVPVRSRLAQLLFPVRDVGREHQEERAVGDGIGDDCRLQRVLPTLSARMKPGCSRRWAYTRLPPSAWSSRTVKPPCCSGWVAAARWAGGGWGARERVREAEGC
jgi:hypothetical protein